MNYFNIYADFLKKRLHPDKKLKIVFDCSNGTTELVLKELFKTNSLIDYQLINQTPNGDFPAHGPNPLASNALNQLQQEVKKQKADLGVIFDADGDRVFFIDNLGRFIDPDVIAQLLIWHLKPKKIVIDSRTGWLVKKYQVSNIKYQISKTGHYFIKKLMLKINADFGAEKSGHYYFQIRDSKLRIHPNAPNKSELNKNIFYYDDGILAAIEAINAVSKLPYSLADFNDLLPQYYRSGELNFKIKNKNLEMIFKKIEKYYQLPTTNYKLQTINHIDGLTIESEDWWFNLRPSNTEPAIRLNIETKDPQTLEKLTKEVTDALNSIFYQQ